LSSGNFLRAFYETDSLAICAVSIQPETAALALDGVTNAIPAGPADQLASAKVSGSRREIGVICRGVYVEFDGAPPEGYSEGSVIFLPWLQPATFAALPNNATGTYLGASVRLVGKKPEFVN
jgi:hypothetical protein